MARRTESDRTGITKDGRLTKKARRKIQAKRKPPRKGKRTQANSRANAAALNRQQMIAKVMGLKRIGYTFEAIGMALKIGTSTARDMWLDGMEQVVLVPVEAERKQMLMQCDELNTTYYPVAQQGDGAAFGSVMRLMDRRDKLLGLSKLDTPGAPARPAQIAPGQTSAGCTNINTGVNTPDNAPRILVFFSDKRHLCDVAVGPNGEPLDPSAALDPAQVPRPAAGRTEADSGDERSGPDHCEDVRPAPKDPKVA
jgi:hypothetical protein